MSTFLKVDQISCRYQRDPVIRQTSFVLKKGDLACLLGPSGCGKTTVLRAIAGFQELLGGSITLDGECISSSSHRLPPELRNIGMVFQDHALFPHLTVAQNVAAGLFKRPRSKQKRIVNEMLERVGLASQRNKYPHQLSGGQQQRVALARALAPEPVLLLMDEPFSNLDVELRDRLGQEVRELLKSLNTTCILVTHDQQDAFNFADKVGVMRAGQIEQWDAPYTLYHAPASLFVARFVGDGVLIDGEIVDGEKVQTELGLLRGEPVQPLPTGTRISLLLRPDDIVHDDNSPQTAKIVKRAFRGESYLYTLALPSGAQVMSLAPSHRHYAIGDQLGIRLEIDHLVIFAKKELEEELGQA